MKKLIYFDYAASTPLDEDIKKMMDEIQETFFYNPSALYGPAVNAKQKIDEAKEMIAFHMGARQSEIILTSGGSESNNLAIRGVMEANQGCKMLFSSIEHESVIAPSKLYDSQAILVDKEGFVDLADLQSKISGDVVLISIICASNEIGTIQPLKEIANIIKEERAKRVSSGNKTPIYLHSDACQATNTLDLHVHSLGIDLLTINGAKMYGPAQTGVLFVNSKVILRPQILGGDQQRGIRSGTMSAPLAIGLAKAFEKAQKMKKQENLRLRKLQTDLISSLEQKFPKAKINGSIKNRISSNLNVSFIGIDNQRLLILLEDHGILASAGSACSASNQKPSHILEAIGADESVVSSSIRFSLGRFTTAEDINSLVTSLAVCIC